MLPPSRRPMMPVEALPTFSLLAPPYSRLLPLDDQEEFPAHPRGFRGAALVWSLTPGGTDAELERAAARPGGLPLMILLPPSIRILRLRARMMELVEETRPHAILPHHPVPDTEELRFLLAHGPGSMGSDVLDYLRWRGLRLDQDTRQVMGRIATLSEELRTLGAVARGLYMSRRALGRRFHDRGLPAPSRWLQIYRQVRAAQMLQSTGRSLGEIARCLGYPDEFTLSNQMDRMVGVRPSLVRERLGWEWFFESWLRREWDSGSLQHPLRGFPPAFKVPDRDQDPHAAEPENEERAERSGEAA
ncbi:MAG: AraC family transcriptional regulator [Gemmatimonadales bacterium]|nr:MAG: AraC family transcriptional regulator [Gemmatimonadales bacterium]